VDIDRDGPVPLLGEALGLDLARERIDPSGSLPQMGYGRAYGSPVHPHAAWAVGFQALAAADPTPLNSD
jgi:hypothetical protein